jgi:hypothetical protein
VICDTGGVTPLPEKEPSVPTEKSNPARLTPPRIGSPELGEIGVDEAFVVVVGVVVVTMGVVLLLVELVVELILWVDDKGVVDEPGMEVELDEEGRHW